MKPLNAYPRTWYVGRYAEPIRLRGRRKFDPEAEGQIGEYDPSTHQMSILQGLTKPETWSTLIHEYCHAWEYSELSGGCIGADFAKKLRQYNGVWKRNNTPKEERHGDIAHLVIHYVEKIMTDFHLHNSKNVVTILEE